jgi:hypothetical protein
MLRENPNLILKGKDPSAFMDAHLNRMDRALTQMESRNSMGAAGTAMQNHAV